MMTKEVYLFLTIGIESSLPQAVKQKKGEQREKKKQRKIKI